MSKAKGRKSDELILLGENFAEALKDQIVTKNSDLLFRGM